MTKAGAVSCALVAALVLAAGGVQGQEYPAKPVRVVVPFPSGGILELIARAVTEKVGANWGQPIIVEPRPGASGNIGAQLARSAARPGKLTAGHPGTGTFGHLCTLLFAGHAGIDWVTVPYKSLPQAVPDLLSGELSFMVLTHTFAAPHLRSGRIKALAVDTPARLKDLPGVPTVLESGFPPQMVAVQWFGFVAPAGTPGEIVRRLNREVGKALESPEVIDRLEKIGVAISSGPAEQFDALIRSESERWTRVIKERKLKTD